MNETQQDSWSFWLIARGNLMNYSEPLLSRYLLSIFNSYTYLFQHKEI